MWHRRRHPACQRFDERQGRGDSFLLMIGQGGALHFELSSMRPGCGLAVLSATPMPALFANEQRKATERVIPM
jgi:hypothetical protein